MAHVHIHARLEGLLSFSDARMIITSLAGGRRWIDGSIPSIDFGGRKGWAGDVGRVGLDWSGMGWVCNGWGGGLDMT